MNIAMMIMGGLWFACWIFSKQPEHLIICHVWIVGSIVYK